MHGRGIAMLTRFKKRTTLILAVSVVGVYLVLPERTIIYRSVKDRSDNPKSWSRQDCRELYSYTKIRYFLMRPPDYIIVDDTAYLRVMVVTRVSSLLMGVIKEEEAWTPERLQRLLTQHPELQNCWPQTEPRRFEVDWIK